jgi:hypothetical protein
MLLECLELHCWSLVIEHFTSCSRRHINVSHEELRELLAAAVGGLHAMQDEHFGISIVEYMAAGASALSTRLRS